MGFFELIANQGRKTAQVVTVAAIGAAGATYIAKPAPPLAPKSQAVLQRQGSSVLGRGSRVPTSQACEKDPLLENCPSKRDPVVGEVEESVLAMNAQTKSLQDGVRKNNACKMSREGRIAISKEVPSNQSAANLSKVGYTELKNQEIQAKERLFSVKAALNSSAACKSVLAAVGGHENSNSRNIASDRAQAINSSPNRGNSAEASSRAGGTNAGAAGISSGVQ